MRDRNFRQEAKIRSALMYDASGGRTGKREEDERNISNSEAWGKSEKMVSLSFLLAEAVDDIQLSMFARFSRRGSKSIKTTERTAQGT